MEATAGHEASKGLIKNLALSHGEILDEPVLEYLSELFVLAANDEGEVSPLCEALLGFLPTAENVEQIVEQMAKELQDHHSDPNSNLTESGEESLFANSGRTIATNPIDRSHLTIENHLILETLDEPEKDMNASVAATKLSAQAKEFVPRCAHESLMISGDFDPVDSSNDTDVTVEDTSLEDLCSISKHDGVDAMGLLSCLYPAISVAALQSLLDANNADVGLCIRLLSQMSFQSSSLNVAETNQMPIDMSEESFPSLPGSGVGTVKIQNQNQADRRFVAALKKTGLDVSKKQDTTSSSKPMVSDSSGFIPQEPGSYSIPWVETGDKVSRQYSEAREEAREYARRRNAYFEQATKAYVSGNKALAKELGIKGRWCCDRMKDCHTIASEAIFQERNKCLRAGKTSGSVVLDLHGLHVSEAQRILRRELDLLSQSGASSQTISLLVGTGHHTKGARTPSRLPRAVSTFLETNGYNHKQGRPGVIEVRL